MNSLTLVSIESMADDLQQYVTETEGIWNVKRKYKSKTLLPFLPCQIPSQKRKERQHSSFVFAYVLAKGLKMYNMISRSSKCLYSQLSSPGQPPPSQKLQDYCQDYCNSTFHLLTHYLFCILSLSSKNKLYEARNMIVSYLYLTDFP